MDGHAEIFPVNYVLDRRSIVFRSAGGTKLCGARPEVWNTRLSGRRRASCE